MIKKIKTEYLLILAILIITPVFVWLIVLRFSGNKIQNNGTQPGVNIEPTKPPSLTLPTGLPAQKILTVTKSSPIQDTNITYSPIQPIELSFNNALDVKDVKYSVFPNIEVIVRNGTYTNKISIYPKIKWVNGLTKITILAGTIATDGSKLYEPFVYELNTVEPTEPPHVGGEY